MEPTLPTQKFVDVKDIKNGIVYLQGGEIRKILMVSGINFDLKSNEEQEVILHSFQNLLNGLEFPVQFFIHSRKVNVERYLQKIEERKKQETNALLKIQIEEYVDFVKTFVEENSIVEKTFFATISYSSTPLIGGKGVLGGITSLFKSSKPAEEEEKETKEGIQKKTEQLNYRVSSIIDGLQQMGLRATPLADEELVELFYNLYNPQQIEKKKLEKSNNNHD